MKPTRIKAPSANGGFVARGCVLSPYYPRARGTYITTMKAIAGLDYAISGTGAVGVGFYTGSTLTDAQNVTFDMAGSTDALSLIANATTAINAYATLQGYTLSEGIYWPFPPLPVVATTYQTVVSQTGTSAPATAGGITPINTYSGITFTWARTSAGVYTLTASAAAFSTTGKTAVLISPVNNLNGAITAVITSTTVITITTAVQSLAVLGLLGFTATPTDALLTKAAVQVLTYN